MPNSTYGPYVLVPNTSGGQSRVCPEMVRAVTVAYWRVGLLHLLVWTQGGLNAGAVAASARVHNGLCVADLRTTNMTKAQVWAVAESLLECGVLANIRGVVDSLTDHFHCVMCDPKHGHKTARDQVAEYRAGGDGLIGERPFYGPKVPFTTWEDSPYYGTSDFDMATPAEVWTAKLGEHSAGKILLAILTEVRKAAPPSLSAQAVADTLLKAKIGSKPMTDWGMGHLIDWTARATGSQGETLTQINDRLNTIQADLSMLLQALQEPDPVITEESKP